jgi:hypothetical protein
VRAATGAAGLAHAPGSLRAHGARRTVLVGGSRLRVLRLRPEGAAAVARWWAGERVGDGTAERRLARRLLDAGLAHPDPPAVADRRDVTVVIPVRDRPGQLQRCLAAVALRCSVVVVETDPRTAMPSGTWPGAPGRRSSGSSRGAGRRRRGMRDCAR